MTGEVELLLDEFAARHARGERPDVRDFLARAGAERDELARLLDGYLAAAPVQPPSEETVILFESLIPVGARLASPSSDVDTPPLLAERVRRGWRRAEVVDWLCERFAITADKRGKVDAYWHQVETGLLPVSRVSSRSREALSERFGEAAEAAGRWTKPTLEAEVAYRRVPSVSFEAQAAAAPLAKADPAHELDEVDRLFGTSPLP